jgi:hypothetical protein
VRWARGAQLLLCRAAHAHTFCALISSSSSPWRAYRLLNALMLCWSSRVTWTLAWVVWQEAGGGGRGERSGRGRAERDASPSTACAAAASRCCGGETHHSHASAAAAVLMGCSATRASSGMRARRQAAAVWVWRQIAALREGAGGGVCAESLQS